jgi:C-terminal processing protease CtpA/Prc
MKKRLVTVLALIALSIPQFALAADDTAEKKKRCSASAQKCVHKMTEQFENRGWIGIEMDKEQKGRKVITKVIHKSPAERAGLEAGDAIVSFNGISLSEGEETVYAEMKKALIPDKQITLGIERDGARLDIDVTLTKVPKELLAQWVGQHMLDQHAHAPEGPGN